MEPAEWDAPEVVAFDNGRWFDGRRFIRRATVYIVNGRIETRRRQADRRIDLAGAFVTPPFGDAHTHGFDGPFAFAAQRRSALQAGVFYSMTMTAPASSTARIRDRFQGPTNVDVQTALGGITGPESHPAEIYEANALGYYSYEQQLEHRDEIRASRRQQGNSYHAVSSAEDLAAAWARLMQQRPDFVKIYLRSSERYHEGWGKWGPGGGLDPNLLPAVAELAQAAGLRLAIAVNSVSDFRAAVRTGAAIVTHLPCYQDTEEAGPDSPYYDVPQASECMLSAADARAARRNGVAATLIASEWRAERPAHYELWEAHNVRVLRRAGARLVIGSNAYGSTILSGLVAEGARDMLDRPTLLRIATMDTPQVIFPDRAVGCLRRGCEASFLVFDADPSADMSALTNIRFRVKDGLLLSLAEIDAD
jgi:imidazolonepropionase-like amidohydrolase